MKFKITDIPGLLRQWIYAVVAWPIVSVSIGLLTGFDSGTYIMGMLVAIMLEGMRLHHLNTLAKRASASKGIIWRVNLNDVAVGEIADPEYAKLQLEVFRDPHVYVRQLFNLGSIANHALNQMLRIVPLAAFWIGLGAYLFFPSDFASALQSLQGLTHDEMVAASGTALRIVIFSVFLTFALYWSTGSGSFGFVNHFRAEINRRLRLSFNAAAEGDIKLWGRAEPGNAADLERLTER